MILCFTLWVSAADAAEDRAVPLEFGSPEEWYAAFENTERQFAVRYPEWLRLEAVTPLRTAQTGALTTSLQGLQDQRFHIQSELTLKHARLRDIDAAKADSRNRVQLAHADRTARDEALSKDEAAIAETRARLEHNYLEVRTLLASLEGAAARGAERALTAWWSSYKQMDWERVIGESGHEPRLARHNAAREQAQVSCNVLGDLAKGPCERLFQSETDTLSAIRRLLSERELSRGVNPRTSAMLEDELREFERASAEVSRDIEKLNEQLLAIDDDIKLAQDALDSAHDNETTLLSPVRESFVGIDLQYGALIRAVYSLDSRIDEDRWCALFVHAGLTRVMAGQPGAAELLQVAASAHQGTCRATMAAYSDVPAFQVVWAEALYLAAQIGQAYIWFPVGRGVWALDGVTLDVGAPTLVPVTAGIHRVEYRIPNAPVVQTTEDLHTESRFIASWSSDGSVTLDLWPLGSVSVSQSLASPHPPWMPDEPDRDEQGAVTEARRTRLILGARALSFQSIGMLGLTAGASWRVTGTPRGSLSLGLALDAARGDSSYRLSDNWVSPTLPRVRGTLDLHTRPGVAAWTLELSGGLVPPTAAGLAYAGLGVDLRFAPGRYLHLEGGAHATLWAGDQGATIFPEFGPELSVGVVRWD